MNEHEWPSDWLRAALPLVSLGILSNGPTHGYALLQELSSRGVDSVKGGTLYPLLARQENLGHIEHSWETKSSGPARKVFRLTNKGRREYERLAQAWRHLNGVVDSVTTSAIPQTEQK